MSCVSSQAEHTEPDVFKSVYTSNQKHLKDLGIPERQKVRKQGRDDRTKQWKYTTPLQRSFSIYVYNEKRYVGGLLV